MKFNSRLLATLAVALIMGISFTARAEVQPGYPVQYEIEARQVVATHRLNVACCDPMQADESIAPPVLFANGSDKLTSGAKVAVKKVAAMLKSPAYKGKHVLVSGYTDNKGKDAANQRLSYHRAVNVVKQLVKDGVPSSQLTAQGFGKENPAGDNATAAGRAQNRRVTFTLGDKK